MRKYLIVVIIFISITSFGQVPYELTFGSGQALDFEDTSTTKYFYIDSSITDNIWQIGKPQKIFFDSAYSSARAIVTDTLNTYPTNNFSVFNLLLLRTEGFMWFDFYHKYDTDSLEDGGTIEISLDGGTTWGNVIDNSFLANYTMNHYGSLNFYSLSDSVKSLNTVGFSGSSDEWVQSRFEIYYQNAPSDLDTFLIRFRFTSDSLNTNREGWLIDNIVMGASHVGIEENSSNDFLVYPNPTYATINIQSLKNEVKEINIYNSLGEKILTKTCPSSEIDISHFSNGVYLLTLNTNRHIYCHKIIKQ